MCDAAQNWGVRDKVRKYEEYIEELGVAPVLNAIKKGRCCYAWFRIKRALHLM